MCSLHSSPRKQVFHCQPWRLKSCPFQSDSQGKVSYWAIIRSQTYPTWWKRENLKIRRENIQIDTLRTTGWPSQSVGWWGRARNSHHSFSWRSLSQKDWPDLWAINSEPGAWGIRQIYCDWIWWLLGCDVFSRGLWFCWTARGSLDCS